ncbi:MAG: L-lactate dehydrogenase [Oscillospiraceae bacterium]|nr:L-lactate dehydrogenase [Oscillospiraceae bacterium]
MKSGKKIVLLGAGNVGATIAYTLTLAGTASEIVLIDINADKARGEAMDILQGTSFSAPVNIYAGSYEDAANADIVVITVGFARKTGQSRLDLAQANVDIVKSILPQITAAAPGAVYVVVSNPVDILTYAVVKSGLLPEGRVLGSGTILDTTRLRSLLAAHVGLNIKNVHAYVFGEHGDSAVIPWSLITVGGMPMTKYCEYLCSQHNRCGKIELGDIERDVRTAGAEVIRLKGATYYAIGMSVNRICECILRGRESLLCVSSMMHGEYGIEDVALSIPFVVGSAGVERPLPPPLTAMEEELLRGSAQQLKEVIASLQI